MSTTTAAAPQQLIITVDDAELVNKVKNAIKMIKGVSGVSVVKKKKTGLDLAREDVAAGRVREWNSVEEMFNTILSEE